MMYYQNLYKLFLVLSISTKQSRSGQPMTGQPRTGQSGLVNLGLDNLRLTTASQRSLPLNYGWLIDKTKKDSCKFC